MSQARTLSEAASLRRQGFDQHEFTAAARGIKRSYLRVLGRQEDEDSALEALWQDLGGEAGGA